MIKTFPLNGKWTLCGGGYRTEGTIPGSVYSFLLDEELIDEPFYRDNELQALALMDNEFITPHVITNRPCDLRVILTDPDGCTFEIAPNKETPIIDPQLWWPLCRYRHCPKWTSTNVMSTIPICLIA